MLRRVLAPVSAAARLAPSVSVLVSTVRHRTSFAVDPELSKTLTRLIYHEHHRPRTVEEDEHIAAGGGDRVAGGLSGPTRKSAYRFTHSDGGGLRAALNDVQSGATAVSRQLGGNQYNVAEAVFESKMEVRWIAEHVNDLDLPDQDAFEKEVKRCVLERVDERKPLAYVLGSQPFLGCDIACRPPLLIPRTETEEWVQWLSEQYLAPVQDYNYPNTEAARARRMRPFKGKDEKDLAEPSYLQRRPGGELARMRVLDLCCGTGCIGAALLRQFDWVEVVGVDIDQRACETAFENYYNAARRGVRQRITAADDEAREARRLERRRRAGIMTEDTKRTTSISEDQYLLETDDAEEGENAAETITSVLPKEEQARLRLQRRAEELEKRVDEEHERVNKGRISVVQSDFLRDIPAHLMKRPDGLGEGFDIILCNPPYLLPDEWKMTEPSVRMFESRLALVGDERHEQAPLSYFKELRDEGPKWLCAKTPRAYQGPRLMFEVGLQARYMPLLFAENPLWGKTVVHCDRFDQPRWVESGLAK